MHFRRHTDHVGKHLHKNIIKSMSIMIKVLTLLRVRQYARKARAYRKAYESNGEGAMGKDDIEKQIKISRRHRSALDIDWKFINES